MTVYVAPTILSLAHGPCVNLPPPISIPCTCILGIGGQAHAHEDPVVRVGGHVLQVVGQAGELIEAALLKGVDGRGAVSVELGLQLGEATMPGHFDKLINEDVDQPHTTVIGVRERSHHANVPLPAARALVQGGVADDLAVGQCQQGQVLFEVQLLGLAMKQGAIGDAMLDQKTVGWGNGLMEPLQGGLIILLERTHEALDTIAQEVADGELVEGEFNHGLEKGCALVSALRVPHDRRTGFRVPALGVAVTRTVQAA